MYIITFYSYRGGVGRTTALVNVGLELARRGRKVLLVDFDLESPDLTNFQKLAPPEPHAGVVEYITAYREKGWVQDVKEYLCPLSSLGEKWGQVWVMPAGRGDREYWADLAEIDWQGLYERQEGYLFFEDTREQWRELGPDYVLIDAHAGVTPALGITTRQLADAVVMVDNPHHGGGLELDAMADQIAAEAEQTGREPIRVFYVASGWVEADGVSGEDCRERIHHDDFSVIIPLSHRLLLGKQVVIGNDARDSITQVLSGTDVRDSLAKAYQRLTNDLITANYAHDPVGARLLLRRIHADPALSIERADGPTYFFSVDHGKALDHIVREFNDDADIQAEAACCFFASDQYSRALESLGRALEIRPDSPELLWRRASYLWEVPSPRSAAADLLRLLDVRGAELEALNEGDLLEELKNMPLFSSPFEDEFLVAAQPSDSLPVYSDRLIELPGIDRYVASAVWQLRHRLPEYLDEAMRKPVVAMLSPDDRARLLADRLPGPESDPRHLVQTREWQAIVNLLGPYLERAESAPLEHLFYLFLAIWGLGDEERLQECARRVHARFLQRVRSEVTPENIAMMALVSYCLKRSAIANQLLDDIEERRCVNWPENAPIFSYWRFARITWNQFRNDIPDQRKMFAGVAIRPPCLGKEAAPRSVGTPSGR